VRLAEVRYGDDLRRIALRELGTAAVWVDLAILNGLRPPYIVQTESERVANVLVAGDPIKIPAAESYVSADADPAAVFGRDFKIQDGKLVADAGDLAVASGLANFLQALAIRLQVVKRELGYHPEFGNFAPQLKGGKLGPAVGALAALYAKSSLLEDPRVLDVPSCVATIEGAALRINAQVVPISGRPLNISTVI
jgi:hypothetical protein